MENSDEYYIEKYLEGEKENFEILIKRNIDQVYSFVFHIVKDKNVAEDVTQEVFIKVWKNIKKYNKRKNFKSWIFAIAHNTTIDWLRKKKSIIFSEFANEKGDNFFESSLVDTEPLADEIFSVKENISMVKECLEKLSPQYKEVLFLHYNQGLTFEEIGEVLKKSINTVKSQHRRALIKLKEEMHQK